VSSPMVWLSNLRRRKEQQKGLESRESGHGHGVLSKWAEDQKRRTPTLQLPSPKPARTESLAAPEDSSWEQKHSEYFAIKHDITEILLPEGGILEVGIEYCTARRPSRNGSLRGSRHAYVKHCNAFQSVVEQMLPSAGSNLVTIVNNDDLDKFGAAPMETMSTLGGNCAVGSLRPYSAELIRSGTGASGRQFEPRIGAFEVAVILRVADDHGVTHSYGPLTAFSKLKCGRWPWHDKLAKRFRGCVEMLLEENEQRLAKALETPSEAVSEQLNVEGWSSVMTMANQLDPLMVPDGHELIVRCEYCIAKRPSMYLHLRGSSLSYVKHFQLLGLLVEKLMPMAHLEVNTKPHYSHQTLATNSATQQEATTRFEISLPVPTVTPHRLPLSAHARRHESTEPQVNDAQDHAESDTVFTPRIGAFEVEVMLQGPSSGARYGPLSVFSKLGSHRFPQLDRLLLDLREQAEHCIMLAQQPGGSAYQGIVQPRLANTPIASDTEWDCGDNDL
jgi:hypothetical protein